MNRNLYAFAKSESKYEIMLDFIKKWLYNYDRIRHIGGKISLAIEESADNIILDANAIGKIECFLKPKKRAAVFSILSNGGPHSQKSLADAIGSSATALSNILFVFQSFEYQLLEFSNVGKYRFYKLSTIGEAYLKSKVDSSAILNSELNESKCQLISEANISFEEFKHFSPDNWEIIMSHLLEKRLYGREVRNYKQKSYLEADNYEKVEQALNRYLACVELAELKNDHTALDQILNLIQNQVLRGLIADIVDIFCQFVSVIRALDDDEKPIENYLIVKNAFSTQNDKEVKKYTNSLGWSKEKFDSLRKTANNLKQNVAHMDEEEIYRYFLSILPGRISLCAYIARCICSNDN